MTISRKLFIVGISALAFTGMMVHNAVAAEKKMQVKMSGAQEVPPNTSKGTGTADVTYNTETRELKWSVSTSGLSGPGVAAHLHGPAAEGANGGVVANLAPNGVANPLTGSATLTEAQAADLMAGKTYINVHTAANPGGEVRGQVKP